MKNKYAAIFSVFISFVAYGQTADTLSLEEAIGIALHNNHNILIAQNEAEIARNNARAGNAGLLPRAYVAGGYNTSLDNLEMRFVDDQIPPIEQSNVRTHNYNAEAGLSYLLFDGFGNIYNFQRLRLQGDLGGVQARMDIENTIFQMTGAFLESGRLQEVYETDQMAFEISRDRLERIQIAYEFGAANRLEVLNAEVDYITDSINVSISQMNLRNSLRDLNIQLGREPRTPVTVRPGIAIIKDLREEEIMEQALARNARVRMADYNMSLSQADVRLARAAAFPRIEANAGYGLNRMESDAGFMVYQQTIGFNGGLNVNFNLFDGRQRVVRERNANISLDNARKNRELTKIRTEAEVANAYENYRNYLQLLDLEQRSIEVARLNFERSEEELRLGQITSTQFREAQINLIRTEIRRTEMRYQAKLAEMELYRLAGLLSID